ncbi:MAG: helix-turn-helix domain-containing protein [bacterium]|nr:helix-turn-helix domain-containing protein [bacterium]
MPSSREKILEFGRELTAAREYKRITLDGISEETKIHARYLRAMEEGEWDVLPRPYMEVFLKAYAETVGMNVPKVMKKYREMVRSELREPPLSDHKAGSELTEEIDEELNAEPEQKSRYGFWVVLLIALLLLVILMGVLIKTGLLAQWLGGSPKVQQVTQNGSNPNGNGQAPGNESANPALNNGKLKNLTVSTESIISEIKLEAKAVESCWLKARVDGASTQEYLLAAGDSTIIKAEKELGIVIGNAGGVLLILGTDSLGAIGPKGRVMTLVIGPEGIRSQQLGSRLPGYREPPPPDTTAVTDSLAIHPDSSGVP